MRLSEIAAELYGLDPGEFVAARKDRAAQAKDAGDRELAAAVADLRKPTVAAWTVNLLARGAPDEVNALLRLGAALRDAQRTLSGDDLRQLTRQRQHVVSAVATRAGELAVEHDRPVGEPVLREVAATLTAALADPEVADQVRSGTLAKAASYEGFGEAAPALAAVPDTETDEGRLARKRGTEDGRGSRDRARQREDQEAERRKAADEELDAARRNAESARTDLHSAEGDAADAEHRLRETGDRLNRLREELTAAEEQHRFARTAERAARETARAAATELERAERRVQRAERARAELD
ncbi:hypothetical protein GV792_03435 [Nocardia cyriacigeorgica]|uniref:Uncharacterized protein n=1 Tax=Nocardia cyriacigeorgica TaxID=135487 RepID=A0A6P1D327_9NOCA|nr:hypothetical protein [Nocardia cyriacigeorgica]NEW44995.1 hypothetical protein [Nocardia cyriacigeorgica]NEW49094.1 hypothetical protein [Nocardia cyriacigeorgica]